VTVRSLVFVANARLPTEKAHGHAIVKLCEAFSRLGVTAELWHPRRHQPNPAVAGRSVFDYYGVPPVLTVRTLPNLDVVRLERWLPSSLFQLLFALQGAAWGSYVARRAVRDQVDLYVTRDVLVAWRLVRKQLPTVLDVHVVPKGPRRKLLRLLADAPALRGYVALTQVNRESLLAMGIPPDLVVVAGSGVDPHQYENLSSRQECRVLHGLPLGRAIVGYVGRFQTLGQEKGIAGLIQAVGLLKARTDTCPLLLCVGGPMDPVPGYLALSRSVGLRPEDVRFVDHVPACTVPTWIRSLDIAVAPFPDTDHMARYASPLKLYEYMAAGVPIVASDLPTMREAVGSHDDVRFVPAGNAGALAGAIEEALQGCGAAAKGRRRPTVFSWEDRARVLLSHVNDRGSAAPRDAC